MRMRSQRVRVACRGSWVYLRRDCGRCRGYGDLRAVGRVSGESCGSGNTSFGSCLARTGVLEERMRCLAPLSPQCTNRDGRSTRSAMMCVWFVVRTGDVPSPMCFLTAAPSRPRGRQSGYSSGFRVPKTVVSRSENTVFGVGTLFINPGR